MPVLDLPVPADPGGELVRTGLRPGMAHGATKPLVWSGLGGRVEAALPQEARTVPELSSTADSREGLAAVIERRAPRFTGS